MGIENQKLPLVFLVITARLMIAAGIQKHNISLVVMAPFPDGELTKGWDEGPSLFPATVVAAREINNSTDILPAFNLRLIRADSGCSAVSKVAISFLRDIYENRDHQVVGIVGPGCSAAALRVASLTRQDSVSLIHITPSATSPELEDDSNNTTYATISSALSYVQVFLGLMRYNDWSSMATLPDEGRPYFKHTHSEFKRATQEIGKKIIFTGTLLQGKRESVIPLEALQSSRARVVIVFAGSELAAQVLCYAYHRGMLFPNYQWIFHDRTMGNLVKNVSTFRVGGRHMNCTQSEMSTASQGVILNRTHLKQLNENISLPVQTFSQYFDEYKEELNGTEPDDYANSYHDAVWAMALALHNASTSGVDLQAYTYNRSDDTKVIARFLGQVNFDGVSGPISFQNATRAVESVINIRQIWDKEDTLIGTFDRSREGEALYIDPNTANFINDTYSIIEQLRVHTALGAITLLLTIVLLVLIALLQLAHILWRRYSSIKATSPNMGHMIFSGCYLFLMFLIFYSLHQSLAQLSFLSFSILCNAMTWCLVFGYTLIFGTLCAKVWRMNRLFRPFKNSTPGVFMSDSALVIYVVLLLFIDSTACLLWNIHDPLILYTGPIEAAADMGVVYVCNCTHWSIWIGSLVAYKVIVILALIIVSILNRQIKRKNFKHTRSITILVYSVTLMGGIGIPLYFLLNQESIYISFGIICTVVLSTVVLCCLTIFLPPVVAVIKEKATYMRKAKHRRTIVISWSSVTEIF